MINSNIQFKVSQLGKGVSLANAQRNYCTYNEQRTNELVNSGSSALPYIDTFLKSANTEEQVLDGLQVLDKMLDRGVKGVDKLYPVISRFNNTSSPNIQVMLAGIYRKTLIPDAFGPLNKMFLRQTYFPNSPYFDPTEEIGGAILEYITKYNKKNNNIVSHNQVENSSFYGGSVFKEITKIFPVTHQINSKIFSGNIKNKLNISV